MRQDVPGFICAFEFAADGSSEPVAEGGVHAALSGQNGWVWLHLNLTDSRCVHWLSDALGLKRPIVEDFAAPPKRVQLLRLGNLIIGHLNDLRRDFDRDSTEHAWLHTLMSPKWIVTGRTRAIQSAERIRRDLARGVTPGSPEAMFDAFLSQNLDTLETVLHQLMDDIEEIEDHILDDQHRGERKRLMLLRRECSMLHRHVRAQRRALHYASRTLDPALAGLGQALNRLDNVDFDFGALENRARAFHDEIDAKLAAETNRQLYILSALTAAFLPPALVAGLFGMNFHWLPWSDTSWGFYIALGLCVLSSIAVWIFLRMLQRD